MIYLFAGNYKQAFQTAIENGWKQGEWIYVTSPETIKGARSTDCFLKVGTWQARPDVAFYDDFVRIIKASASAPKEPLKISIKPSFWQRFKWLFIVVFILGIIIGRLINNHIVDINKKVEPVPVITAEEFQQIVEDCDGV